MYSFGNSTIMKNIKCYTMKWNLYRYILKTHRGQSSVILAMLRSDKLIVYILNEDRCAVLYDQWTTYYGCGFVNDMLY